MNAFDLLINIPNSKWDAQKDKKPRNTSLILWSWSAENPRRQQLPSSGSAR